MEQPVLAMATGWQTIAVSFRQTVEEGHSSGNNMTICVSNGNNSGASKRGQKIGNKSIIGSDNLDGSNGDNNRNGSNGQKWRPAIGGSNQVAGCDRWVTN